MKNKNQIKASKKDRAFIVINYFVLGMIALAIVYPLVYIISSSLSSSEAVMSGRVWLFPVEPTLKGYRGVFKYNQIWVGYGNSIFYAVVGTTINVIVSMLAAYPLSRKDFIGRNIFMGLFTFTMLFSGGLIPTYLVVKSLGIVNTRWAMLLPQALQVWYVIIARTYLQTTIPIELYEASEIDGCSDFRFFTKIILPLSKPIIAVLVLFYAVYHWNSYFDAFIYIKEKRLYPLQIVLRTILIQNEVNPTMLSNAELLERVQGLRDLLKYSLIVVASIPVLMLYPFIQKHFIKGIMVGSLKQ